MKYSIPSRYKNFPTFSLSSISCGSKPIRGAVELQLLSRSDESLSSRRLEFDLLSASTTKDSLSVMFGNKKVSLSQSKNNTTYRYRKLQMIIRLVVVKIKVSFLYCHLLWEKVIRPINWQPRRSEHWDLYLEIFCSWINLVLCFSLLYSKIIWSLKIESTYQQHAQHKFFKQCFHSNMVKAVLHKEFIVNMDQWRTEEENLMCILPIYFILLPRREHSNGS